MRVKPLLFIIRKYQTHLLFQVQKSILKIIHTHHPQSSKLCSLFVRSWSFYFFFLPSNTQQFRKVLEEPTGGKQILLLCVVVNIKNWFYTGWLLSGHFFLGVSREECRFFSEEAQRRESLGHLPKRWKTLNKRDLYCYGKGAVIIFSF